MSPLSLFITIACSLVIIAHVSLIVRAESLDHCPCTIHITTKTADCQRRNLTAIPDCVPSFIKYLLLTRNNLVKLHKGEFVKFGDLQYIEFAINKLEFLEDGCFQGLSKLGKLHLRYNKLQTVQNSNFRDIPELHSLFLNFNEIRQINGYTFIYNTKLRILLLQQNKITHISENAFVGLDMLEFLSLSDNPLYFRDSLPLKVFSPLVSLGKLQLQNVCSVEMKLSGNCTYFDQQISHLPSLREISVEGVPNKTLGNGYRRLIHLEGLYLGDDPYGGTPGSYMLSINSKIFESLRPIALKTLSLVGCSISNIMPHTFDPMASLRTLDLRDNFLCDYYNDDPFAFSGLNNTNIRSLNLADTCRRGQFGFSNAFDALSRTKLEYLNWSNSNAVSILNIVPGNFWQNLPKTLKVLDLHKNKLMARYTNFEHITDLENLQFLDLSNQGTRPWDISLDVSHNKSHSKDMQGIKDGVGASMNHSYSRNILLNQTREQGHTSCLSLPYQLRTLNLSRSDLLPHFIPMFCNTNNSLRVLNISYHKRTTYVTRLWNVIKNLAELEEIDLRGNKIREIPPTMFINNVLLKRLWLGDNSLLTLDLDLISMSKLELIDLSYNSIQYLTKRFIAGINWIARHSTIKINLQNNSLLCNCDHRDFVDWLRYSNTIIDKNKVVCKYRNDSLMSLRHIAYIHNSLEGGCIARVVLISCTSLFIGLTLFGSLVAIIHYQRWNYYYQHLNFNYLLGIGRRNINPYHPLEDNCINMTYDVYISYDVDFTISENETLHNFVTQTLYPAIVSRGFKVLIREELDPGSRLYDKLTSNLRRTELVIVLLTKDYCKDYWNVFEFNMAVMEGIYTRRRVIVPVLLDIILNKEDLHEDVYTYLKNYSVPYVRPENLKTDLTPYLIDRLR